MHPDRAGIAFLEGGQPEYKNVYPLVWVAIVPQGAGDSPRGVLGVPRLVPGPDTGFKLRHNVGSDAGVNVRAGGGPSGHGKVLRLGMKSVRF
jgi:hypothetical protein